MANILLQDNFTGTTIDTNKWTVSNTGGTLSQDGKLIGTNHHNASRDDSLTSIINRTSGDVVIQANLDWTDPTSEEAILQLQLYVNATNIISISNRSATGNVFRLFVQQGGSNVYDFETAITKAKDVKITYNITSKVIKFFYWSGTAWVQMGTTQTYDIGSTVYGRIRNADVSGWTGADLTYLDNLYLSDQDYTTQYPNWDLTLGEYLGAGSGTTKLLLHLNGNSTDSSGNGNNGTDYNITYSQANGKFGQGAGFNGSSSKIALPTTGIPTGNTARTLSVWVYKTSTSIDVVYGIYKSANENPGAGWGIYINNTDVICWLYGSQDFDTGINISLNTWTNLVLTHDGTNIRAYKNGLLISTTAKTLNTGNNFHFLGVNVDINFFNGAIDEVIVENRAWSASEVKKYYTQSRGFFATI